MHRRAAIVIADDHPVIAEALSTSLAPWYRIAAVAHSLDALEGALRREAPALVVLDLSFGPANALNVLPKLVRNHPGTKFVVLTAFGERVLADACLTAGASGFVVKQSAASELRVAIEEALEGRVYVTPLIRAPTADDAVVPADLQLPPLIPLTARQEAILRRLRAGQSYRVIAAEMELSMKTVEYHVRALRARLGLARTAQLIRWAELRLRAPSSEAPDLDPASGEPSRR
jgi:DNA-binding NarL/FixJ family response regulator